MANDFLREHLSLLGRPVEECVTGAKGVVTSVSFDLYGCVHALVTPRAVKEDGKRPDSEWYDTKRLRVTGDSVMAAPEHWTTKPGDENGPEEKPQMSSMPAQ